MLPKYIALCFANVNVDQLSVCLGISQDYLGNFSPISNLDEVGQTGVGVPCLVEFLSIFLGDLRGDVSDQVLYTTRKCVRKSLIPGHLDQQANKCVWYFGIFGNCFPETICA